MSRKRQIIISVLALLSLTLVTTGVSYSLLDYDESAVKAGLIFDYSNYHGTPEFSISNLTPISDELGKKISADGQIFHFSVKGKLKKDETVPYSIVITKKTNSTLADDSVKVYLTEVINGKEYPIDTTCNQAGEVTTFSKLKEYPILPIGNSKVLYKGIAENGYNGRFNRDYKLRIWVDKNTANYQGRSFSVDISIIPEN